MIKHIIWRFQPEKNWVEVGGRLGIHQEDIVENVYVDNENVKLKHTKIQMDYIFGPAPPAEILYELLRALDLDEFHPELERKPYLVECRRKTSGAQDFLKRVLWNREFRDAPIVANLHVSMFGKLNEGVRGHVNDLLLFVDEFPNVFGKNLEFYGLSFQVLEEDELFSLDDFIYPE